MYYGPRDRDSVITPSLFCLSLALRLLRKTAVSDPTENVFKLTGRCVPLRGAMFVNVATYRERRFKPDFEFKFVLFARHKASPD